MVRQEKNILFWIIPFLAVFLAVPLQLLAQGGSTGAISGVVQDSTGAVIANAKVSVRSEATGELLRETKSDSYGLFTATLLPVGTYTVEVNAAGFPATKLPGVVVRITETTRVTAALKMGAVTEVVEVSSQASPVINTADASTGESLAEKTITGLPLSTRNFQQLMTLSAGTSSDLNGAAQLGRGSISMYVNGGRSDNNNYQIDGISVTDYMLGALTYTPLPNPDSIEEFKVGTSLYDATQGRNGGGNINATLKNGTSKFHGDLWEYFRNTALDANDYLLGQVIIKQNIFGGDLGGPVAPKGKLGYFYVNYQGTRQRSGDSPGTYEDSPAVPILPTSRDQTTLLNTFFCGAACGGSTATSIDPVALAFLNVKGNQWGPGVGGGWLFPSLPGTPGLTNGQLNTGPVVLTNPGQFTDDQVTETWNRGFRDGRDQLSERYFWSNSNTYEPFGADGIQQLNGGLPTPDNLDFPFSFPLHSRFGSITETHLFSTSLLNEFRFGINVISDKLQNDNLVTAPQIGINNPAASVDPEIFRFIFNTWQMGPDNSEPMAALSNGYVWLDTLSWTHGKHQFRFGGEIDLAVARRNMPLGDGGTAIILSGATGYSTDFQAFLQGAPVIVLGGGGLSYHDYHEPALSWFAQDDYRVSPTLTLNLGLRNEFVGAPYDALCRSANTDLSLANTTGQPFVWPKCADQYKLAGVTGTLNKAGLDNLYATVWEPRIGFAYDVAGHHTTSIRGGYGIYADREDLGAMDMLAEDPVTYTAGGHFFPNGFANALLPAPGFQGIPAIGAAPTQAAVPTASIFQGFPTGGCRGANGDQYTLPTQCNPNFSGDVINYTVQAIPLHYVIGTSQQWNLTIERQLGQGWFLDVGYIGTKGTHLRIRYENDLGQLATVQNPITIPYACGGGSGSCTIVDSTQENINARVPYRGIEPIGLIEAAPDSDSHYNSLVATVGHHFNKGLYFQGAYTYSKSIDDASTATVSSASIRLNNESIAADSRGLSDFDRRHRFVASSVYQLPFFANASGLSKEALGGWEASGVITVQTGEPFSVMDPVGGSAFQSGGTNASTATFAPGFSCANASSSGSTRSRLANWLNPNAFVPDPHATLSTGGPSDGTLYGDTPRNCIGGPPQANVDFTLGKTFKVSERQNLQFQTDFFNLFNHPSFALPETATVSPAGAYAPITSTVGTPRLVQFSLKYSF